MKGILCFGDSITFDRGDGKNGGWVARLRQFYESQNYYHGVYNLGICGNTTKDLLKRFDVEADSRIKFKRENDEYIILFAIGINDSRSVDDPKYTKVTIKEFKDNIEILVKKAISKKAKVAFIGLIPVDEKLRNGYEKTFFFNERIKEYNQIIKDFCQKQNIPFLDVFNNWIDSDYLNLLSDGLHPNSKGYDRMFSEIKDFLVKHNLI